MIRLASYLVLACGLLVVLWPPATGPDTSPESLALVVEASNGTLLRSFRPGPEQYVRPLSSLPSLAPRALIAVEDRAFFQHPGVNPFALLRAANVNLSAGRVVEGGSTISMQVAHMRGKENSNRWLTKLMDILGAVRLEIAWTKTDLLSAWLNTAPFGRQTRGLEAAARRFFGKAASDLTDAEVLYLIGLPQAPTRYNPARYPERTRARYRYVVDALHTTGVLSDADRMRLLQSPFALAEPNSPFAAPHLAALLERESVAAPLPRVAVRTTLDADLQTFIETSARAFLEDVAGESIGTLAAVVLDNASGDVLAYLGSADFWDEAGQGQNDGMEMLRQPGSTVKPFTYARALAEGRYTPASILADVPLEVLEAGGAFAPQNYDRTFHGPVSLRQALASSYNVPAVRIAQTLGTSSVLEALRSAGLQTLDMPPEHYGVGLTLGNGEVRLIDLATAYMGFARGGTTLQPRFATWWLTAQGDTLHVPVDEPKETGNSPEVSYLITHILQDPEARAPAFGRFSPLELPFPAAVKTGTSKDYRDNWAVGYTPTHTVAVWAGNFDGTPMQYVSGVTGAGSLLHSILRYLGPQGPFPQPPALESGLICPHSGLRPHAACPTQKTEVFLPGTVPTRPCNVHQHILVDRHSGLRADTSTPTSQVEERVYTVYPPIFQDWMRKQQIPLPPPASLTAESLSQARADTTAWAFDAGLQIDFPEDGALFLIDRVLRSTYQQITMKGHAPADVYALAWWLNGLPLATPFHTTNWSLEAGKHTLEIRGVTSDGQRVRSQPITFRVAAD